MFKFSVAMVTVKYASVLGSVLYTLQVKSFETDIHEIQDLLQKTFCNHEQTGNGRTYASLQ